MYHIRTKRRKRDHKWYNPFFDFCFWIWIIWLVIFFTVWCNDRVYNIKGKKKKKRKENDHWWRKIQRQTDKTSYSFFRSGAQSIFVIEEAKSSHRIGRFISLYILFFMENKMKWKEKKETKQLEHYSFRFGFAHDGHDTTP